MSYVFSLSLGQSRRRPVFQSQYSRTPGAYLGHQVDGPLDAETTLNLFPQDVRLIAVGGPGLLDFHVEEQLGANDLAVERIERPITKEEDVPGPVAYLLEICLRPGAARFVLGGVVVETQANGQLRLHLLGHELPVQLLVVEGGPPLLLGELAPAQQLQGLVDHVAALGLPAGGVLETQNIGEHVLVLAPVPGPVATTPQVGNENDSSSVRRPEPRRF
jgi:hypothetical protein